ncbi:hypothetical protein LTR95_002755 [Oleoguttula sp. CCFEE 5521]
MGPGDGLASNHDARPSRSLPEWQTALVSPAISIPSLDSPTLTKSLTGVTSPSIWGSQFGTSDSLLAMPAEPGASEEVPVMSPPANQQADQVDPMSMIVGGVLAPVQDVVPPRSSMTKAGPGFRLPSFAALGIAAPHSSATGRADSAPPDFDREQPLLPLARVHSLSETADVLQPLNALTLHQHNFSHSFGPKPRTIFTPLHQYVQTLTPPADGDAGYRPSVACVVAGAAMDSPATESGSTGHAEPDDQGVGEVGTPLQDDLASRLVITGAHSWVDGAVQTVLANIRASSTSKSLLKVLSHALPSPSPTGHTFQSIIEAIHDSTPSSPTAWINVFHAIPGRFNLEELPTSPPSTPGPAVGGDDYFTQKIFGSAVPITDYQQDLSPFPRSPRPVAPPSSIDVSIVERYIPPSNSREYNEMFALNGPSILIDRLVELSPDNGSLVFIYPTKTGAETFMNEYLSPILDPVLRSMVVTNGFSSDLGLSLGAMPAAHSLLEHVELERRIRQLCTRLTQRSSTMQRFHGRRARFELAYSQTKEVHLTRQAWAKDWWTRQEKVHVTELVTKAAQEAATKSSNRHLDRPPTATELWQKLMRDVETRPYDEGQEPKTGVEIAVFVVARLE